MHWQGAQQHDCLRQAGAQDLARPQPSSETLDRNGSYCITACAHFLQDSQHIATMVQQESTVRVQRQCKSNGGEARGRGGCPCGTSGSRRRVQGVLGVGGPEAPHQPLPRLDGRVLGRVVGAAAGRHTLNHRIVVGVCGGREAAGAAVRGRGGVWLAGAGVSMHAPTMSSQGAGRLRGWAGWQRQHA